MRGTCLELSNPAANRKPMSRKFCAKNQWLRPSLRTAVKGSRKALQKRGDLCIRSKFMLQLDSATFVPSPASFRLLGRI